MDQKIEFELLIEGIRLPFAWIQRNQIRKEVATARIAIPASPSLFTTNFQNKLPRSSVVVFFRDYLGVKRLFFEGEVLGYEFQKTHSSSDFILNCKSVSNYLEFCKVYFYDSSKPLYFAPLEFDPQHAIYKATKVTKKTEDEEESQLEKEAKEDLNVLSEIPDKFEEIKKSDIKRNDILVNYLIIKDRCDSLFKQKSSISKKLEPDNYKSLQDRYDKELKNLRTKGDEYDKEIEEHISKYLDATKADINMVADKPIDDVVLINDVQSNWSMDFGGRFLQSVSEHGVLVSIENFITKHMFSQESVFDPNLTIFFNIMAIRHKLWRRLCIDKNCKIETYSETEEMKNFILGRVARIWGNLSVKALMDHLLSLIFYEYINVPSFSLEKKDNWKCNLDIMKPVMFFAPPPRYNVIFPGMYGGFGLRRDFEKEITKQRIIGILPMLKDDEESLIGQAFLQSISFPAQGVTSEELIKGPIYHTDKVEAREWVPKKVRAKDKDGKPKVDTKGNPVYEDKKDKEGNIVKVSEISNEIKSSLNDYYSMLAEYNYYVNRNKSSNISSINLAFHPYFIMGFPALILSDMPNSHILGNIDRITDSIDASGKANTVLGLSNTYFYSENRPFFGGSQMGFLDDDYNDTQIGLNHYAKLFFESSDISIIDQKISEDIQKDYNRDHKDDVGVNTLSDEQFKKIIKQLETGNDPSAKWKTGEKPDERPRTVCIGGRNYLLPANSQYGKGYYQFMPTTLEDYRRKGVFAKYNFTPFIVPDKTGKTCHVDEGQCLLFMHSEEAQQTAMDYMMEKNKDELAILAEELGSSSEDLMTARIVAHNGGLEGGKEYLRGKKNDRNWESPNAERKTYANNAKNALRGTSFSSIDGRMCDEILVQSIDKLFRLYSGSEIKEEFIYKYTNRNIVTKEDYFNFIDTAPSINALEPKPVGNDMEFYDRLEYPTDYSLKIEEEKDIFKRKELFAKYVQELYNNNYSFSSTQTS